MTRRDALDRTLRPLGAIVQAQTKPASRQPPGAQRLRCALVGFGRRGLDLARAAAGVPQMAIVAVADAYDGRLERAREVLGASIATVREASAVIRRADVDAVLVATPDHLHTTHIALALDAGKPVYCEHPIAHTKDELSRFQSALSEATLTAGGGVLPAAIAGAAREIVREGRLGEVTLVTGWWDTGTALDAWVLPFPPDASSESIDWNAFAHASSAFDPAHFFRWPVFSRYGSGMIGARFVPQLWDIHRVLGLSRPEKCTAAGRLVRWRDGRDTPDVLHTTFEHTNVVIDLGATLNGSGRAQEIRLIGGDATLVLRKDGLELIPQSTAEPFANLGDTWAEPHRRWVFMMHGLTPQGAIRGTPPVEKAAEQYTLPTAGHELTPTLSAFVEAARSGKPAPGLLPATAADVARAGLMCAAAVASGRSVTHGDVVGDAP